MKRASVIPVAVVLALGGCDNGPTIPPSKGGAEARQQVEYPLGPPPARKARAQRGAPKAVAEPSEGPGMVH
jgi:hypothetical protein